MTFYFCCYCCFVMLGKLFHLPKHSIKKKYESLLVEPCLNDSELFRNHSSKWSQFFYMIFSSVQFSHSVTSNSLRPHEQQHASPPCPSPTPKVHPNPCPLSQWCHPTISSSVIPFSSCPQSFPASESFQMS